MAEALIVDDSPLDRRLTARMLEGIGLKVREAENGRVAVKELETRTPDLVLTDLQMPHMDGFELVQHVRTFYPSVPIILMTAFGSEEVAVRALQVGASSYVPKHNLARDLVQTVKHVLSIARARRESRAMLDSMTKLETEYTLGNTVEGLESLLGHFKENVTQMRIFGDGEVLRVSTALYEAILNAIEHGNLEMQSSQRDQEGPYYRRVVEERGRQAPYRNRHVYVQVQLTRSHAKLTVRDEGSGFDHTCLPDPTAPENVGKSEGRGLFLIRTFMDDVQFNDNGNEVTMIKNRTT